RAAVRVFSDDGMCVHDPLLMRRALEYVATFDGVVAQHAQEPRLTQDAQMNEGALSSELGLTGWPAVAEAAIIARDVLLAAAFGGVGAQRGQEPRLTQDAQMNEGALSSELGLTGWPAVAEEAIIARDVLLAEAVGARLHICHLSTAGSVEVVRWAKSRGIAV